MSVRVRHAVGLVWIELDRPRANVLDGVMVARIRQEIAALRRIAGLKLVVFEGRGTEFSFGGSAEEHTPDRVRQMLTDFHAMFREIEALGVPTAAVVRGRCLGGGLELAAFCGRVFAAPGASLALPEIRLGGFPPLGALILPWRMGGSRAAELILTGGALAAGEAQAVGLVDEVAPDPAVALQNWFDAHLAPLSASSLSIAWRAVRMPVADRLEHDLPRLEALYLGELMATQDAGEGISAFLERRPPRYVHR